MNDLALDKWSDLDPVKLELPQAISWRDRGQGTSVFITRKTFEIVEIFLGSDVSREHGGFLIGGVVMDGSPETSVTTFVKHAVPCPSASGTLSHLTFDHDCWELVNNHPNIQDESLSFVGWFHSHPGMQVTMSKKDKFIQSRFFGSPWQVAWIMNPIESVHALYSSADSKFHKVTNIEIVEGSE